ncbi:WhiB family transcriptional regulator [Nocardia sp. NPDC052001]|uniref:WhiB family transcriptional regulator n=1 Tax=Nocardia sp. NPDC052001 TaxID=3154853 RepID=UPI00343174AD
MSSSNNTVIPSAKWAQRACAEVNPEDFYPTTATGVHAAQQICASCPVLSMCAELAPGLRLSGCVVGSVWVPKAKDEIALKELAEVAATGKPAPLAERKRVPKDRTHRWNDPEFRKQVVRLHDEHLTWVRIAARLDCTPTLARRAYAAELGIELPKRSARAGVRPKSTVRRTAAPAARPAPAPVVTARVRAARKCARDLAFQQQVAQLRMGDDLTWSEIAARLGCAASTAKNAYAELESAA